jgi:hypothetical protein
MDTINGKRLASFVFYIRVNQLEVRLDKDIGTAEATLHNAKKPPTILDGIFISYKKAAGSSVPSPKKLSVGI